MLPVVLLGMLDPYVFLIFFLATSVFGVFLSWFGIYSEVTTYRRFNTVTETVLLLYYGAFENFGYRQWKSYIAWRALYEYLTGVTEWGVMERSGFDDEEVATGD